MEDGPPRFPQDSSCPVVLGSSAQGAQAISLTGLSPSLVSLSRTPQLQREFLTPRQSCNSVRQQPATPSAQRSQASTCTGFGLFPLRSPLLGESLLLSFPTGTKMVHFPGFASHTLLDSGADAPILFGASLEDSDVPGSQPVCGSPRLIAAYHVLLRLPSPRHPPYALSSLTIKFAPPEILPDPRLEPFYGPLVFSFYPSLSDCQRSKSPDEPEIKGSTRKPLTAASSGGGKRIRTADPLLAKQVLSQLSYTPGPARARVGGPR